MFDIITIIGWLAALLTFSAYSMRTMLPLRVAAIGANICFIAFSYFEWIVPTLALHSLLLPFNVYRLWELLHQTWKIRQARASDPDPLHVLAPLMKSVTYPAGATVFRKGDAPDKLYYLKSGTIRFPEVDAEITDGTLFGEIAFFTDSKQRTASAVCASNCQIMAVDEAAFMRLFYQNPAFGLHLFKLAAQRLLKNSEDHVTPKTPLDVPEI